MKKMLFFVSVFCLNLNLYTEAMAVKADSFYAEQFTAESWLNMSKRHVRVTCKGDYCEIAKIIANGSIELYSTQIHLENDQQAIISCPVNICSEKIRELTIYTDDGLQIPVDISWDENIIPNLSKNSSMITLNADNKKQIVNEKIKEIPDAQSNKNSNQCQFEVKRFIKKENNPIINTDYNASYINVTCLSDECKISGLVVNRGNKDFTPKNSRPYPIELKYGEMVLFEDTTEMRAINKAAQGVRNDMEFMQKWIIEMQKSPELSSPAREVKVILDGSNSCNFYFDRQ